MGRKLNLSHLSEAECQHILEVVNKDFNIRYQEKERIRVIEADVEADENQYSVLSRSSAFNERYCLCCYSRFLPLINPRVLCDACRSGVCKSCAQLDRETSERRCKVCLKQRELQKQSNDWFYSSVKRRFRRCGSAKVIRSLYKRRVTDDDVSLDTRMLVSRSDSEFVTHNWNNLNENGSTSSHTCDAADLKKASLGVDDGACSASGGQTAAAAAMEGQWKRDGKTSGGGEDEEGEGEGGEEDGRFQKCRKEEEEKEEEEKAEEEERPRSASDRCIQTEREGVTEVGTMTAGVGGGGPASRFFHSFDGMATVSTEGQETDPEFVTRPHNVRVLEGDSLHVEVKVNGSEPLDVLWFSNRNQVQQLDEDDRCEVRRHGNTFVMTLYDVRQDDTREFLCIGVNAVGQCAQGFTVTVDENAQAQLPPIFNNQTDNIEIVPEGSDAVLRCSVSAYPEPRITWMRNNRPVMQGGRHRIERHVLGAFQYSLVIELVRADDSGCYVAVARNAAGESRLPVQLLIQPNPIESGGAAGGADSSQQTLAAYSSGQDPDTYLDNNEADLLRIAQDLSRTQGRFTTTATRMLRSADTMSSMQSQLDAMDKALEGLEVGVLDVLSDDDDDDSSDEDSLNNNNSNKRCNSWRRLTNEIDDMKSSAKAVGMVTSAALQLLSSAKEIAMETLSENEYSGNKQELEQDAGGEGGGGEGGGKEEVEEDEDEDEEKGGEEECVYADDLDLSYQELEKLYEVRLISRSELKRRLIQRKSVKDVRAYLRNQSAAATASTCSSSSAAAAGVAHGDQSEEDSAMETSVDSLETGPEAKVRRRKRRTTADKRERTELVVSMCSSSSSGDGKRRSAESDGIDETLEKEGKVLEETEQQIYLTSGKIFSLEDCIRELETKVMEVDEATPAEILASLENSVARAVAQVTQSDNEVNEIERQVDRWMEKRSDRTTKRCNDRFRQEQQLLQPPVTSSSSPDNHQTESVVIATTPDAENNTTSIIG